MIYLDVLTFFKNWIIRQLHGETSIEKTGSAWSSDHTYPLSKISLSNEEDISKCNHWTNIRPMYNTESNSKKAKIDHHLYLLQIKAENFRN